VDLFISAELPDRTCDPELFNCVTDLMMHGPCGVTRAASPCMVDGSCIKKYPKTYEPKTRFDSEGRVFYKPRKTGPTFLKNGIPLDDTSVVPYNAFLCKVFNAHINVEYCGWSMLIKYLFKYISKGPDRVRFKVTTTCEVASDQSVVDQETRNEVKEYVDSRYLCPHEAAWRIFNFPIHHRIPAVQVLAVHLEGKQTITLKGKLCCVMWYPTRSQKKQRLPNGCVTTTSTPQEDILDILTTYLSIGGRPQEKLGSEDLAPELRQ
jgi:hypothetical protein